MLQRKRSAICGLKRAKDCTKVHGLKRAKDCRKAGGLKRTNKFTGCSGSSEDGWDEDHVYVECVRKGKSSQKKRYVRFVRREVCRWASRFSTMRSQKCLGCTRWKNILSQFSIPRPNSTP